MPSPFSILSSVVLMSQTKQDGYAIVSVILDG